MFNRTERECMREREAEIARPCLCGHRFGHHLPQIETQKVPTTICLHDWCSCREFFEQDAAIPCRDCHVPGQRVPTSDGTELYLCGFHFSDLQNKISELTEADHDES